MYCPLMNSQTSEFYHVNSSEGLYTDMEPYYTYISEDF